MSESVVDLTQIHVQFNCECLDAYASIWDLFYRFDLLGVLWVHQGLKYIKDDDLGDLREKVPNQGKM